MFERDSTSRILPFAVYLFFMLAVDVLTRFGFNNHDLRCLYAVKVATVAAIIWALRRRYCELRFPNQVTKRSWAIAVVSGAAVFVTWINLNADWMTIGTSDGFDPRGVAGMDWWRVSARLLGAALVVPVMEELFWRSFLLRWLVNNYFMTVAPARVGLSAFVITATFFAFEHNLWLAGLIAGIAYNLLYIRSGNLWVPIVSHATTNALLGGWVIYTGSWEFW